jgi:Lipoprotein LpqB beta-propeller domain/Sporulation and spore germination
VTPHRSVPRSRRRFAALVALVLCALVTGCATVPDDGPPVDYTQVADPGNQARPTEPTKGLSPLEVTRGFITASARIDQDGKLTVAATYLTQAAQASWQPGSAEVMILTAPPRLDPVPDRPGEIQVSGTSDGYLRADGSYVPTTRTSYLATVGLEEVDGQWRIHAPPRQIVMSTSDFNLAYTQRQLYFLNSTSTVVVPDRRWLPNRSQYPVTMATDLINRLLAGPAPGLLTAVRNGLAPARLRAAIVATPVDGVLQVDLTGLPAVTAANASALAAQIVYTLRSDAANIRIQIDGVPLDNQHPVWTLTGLGAFDPDARPGAAASVQGYYLDAAGALRDLRGDPVAGLAGSGSLRGVSAARAAASGAIAIVGNQPSGQTLFLGSPPEQEMTARLTAPGGLTPPSFSRAGDEVWTVIKGPRPEVVRMLTAGTRYPVDASALAGLSPVTALALSPDGTRAALVAGQQLYLSMISYSADPTGGNAGATANLSAPLLVRNDLEASQVVWADSQNMLVAGSDASSTYRSVWRVGLDGRQRSALTVRGIVADVDAVASTGGLPVLISFGARIYELRGDDTFGDWVPAGATEGSWPVYPS